MKTRKKKDTAVHDKSTPTPSPPSILSMVLQCYKLRGLAKWMSGQRLLGRQGGCSAAPREQLSPPSSLPPPLPVESSELACIFALALSLSLSLSRLDPPSTKIKRFPPQRRRWQDIGIFVKREIKVYRTGWLGISWSTLCNVRLQAFSLSNAL